jgi:hypothetical protein
MDQQPNVNHDGSQPGPDDDDPFAPPKEPCECYCLHCRRVFMSSGMWFQRIVGGDRSGLDGFWMCPTPNCGGAGFTFDIFPTDPDHPANEGWHDFDDDEECEDDGEFVIEPDAEPAADWDPDETKYKELDEELGEDDDDLEGEEWKYGLAPGELPHQDQSQGRLEWEEEQKRFDMPDERPREVDWSDREERQVGGGFNEDDIPF